MRYAARASRVPPPPIYLHFLDRELGEAFEFELRPDLARRALLTLALGTASPLVCSASALFENDGLRGSERLIADLAAAEALIPKTTHATLDEFLETRRELYVHDQARYPRYFGAADLGALSGLQPRTVPGSSTTSALHGRLEAWTEGQPTIRSVARQLPGEAEGKMLGVVADELLRREDQAITYAMFRRVGEGDPSGRFVERVVRQQISLEYTDHQRGNDAQLPTGIWPSLDVLERALQPEWPFEFDIPVLRELLVAAGLGVLVDRWEPRIWELLLPLRGSPQHMDVVRRVQWIGRALEAGISEQHGRALRRQQAIMAIRAVAPRDTAEPPADAQELLTTARIRLNAIAEGLTDEGYGPALDSHAGALDPLRVEVLLIVATNVEERSLLDDFGFPEGKDPPTYPRGLQIYYELDRSRRVYMVRSEMGASRPGGSAFTADDAMRDVSPAWVIMVGISFGADPVGQNIGDVLVPVEVVPYDHKRVSTGEHGEPIFEHRDPPVLVDAALLKRMRAAANGFDGADVLFGRVLSGSDLVDNEAHRDGLVKNAAAGKALGGEMEFIGVLNAAARHGARCGAAKAICDFGADKGNEKDAKQKVAAENAARFVRHLIDSGHLDNPPVRR